MLPIPRDLDLSSYCDSELGSIVLGPCALTFAFYAPHPNTPGKSGAELRVLVQGPWALANASGETVDDNDAYSRRAPSRLNLLLSQRVSSVQVAAPDTIRFAFTNGYVLAASTDNTGLECLSIDVPDAQPHVF